MKSHHLIVGACAILGMAMGGLVWHTEPSILGWVFGLGMGLLGGAFLASVTSGTSITTGGGKRTRREREWLLRGDDDQK